MSTPEQHKVTPSPEAELARKIEDLIRKLAAGEANQSEIEMLYDLQKRRVDRMRPRMSPRRARVRARAIA